MTDAGFGSAFCKLTGNSMYTGATTISAGTLQIGTGALTGGAASIGGTSGVLDSGSFVFDVNKASTFSGVISGSGNVVHRPPTATDPLGNNTYTGGTTISAGTVQLGNGNTSGSPRAGLGAQATLS